MEHLTKQQIVLLCLLVSFVSSIATGIVTVSLLDQAPPAVTQTINRVVERTIQTVGANATTTKETVIVKDDQAIVDAIARASKAIVRIQSDGAPIAVGFLATNQGRIIAVTDAQYGGVLTARLEGGNVVPVSMVTRDPQNGITVYQAEQSLDPARARAYASVVLADAAAVRLGQSVVAIAGSDAPVVGTGIVSSAAQGRIATDIRDPHFDSQGILVNLLGEVVGMRDLIPDRAFTSSNHLKTYATP